MSITPVNTDVVGVIKDENDFEYNVNDIPKDVIRELAKTFLPDIIEFYDLEEGKDFYENWKKNNKKISPKKKQGVFPTPCNFYEK